MLRYSDFHMYQDTASRLAKLGPGHAVSVSSLPGASRDLFMAEFCAAASRPALIVCRDAEEATRTHDNLVFFAPALAGRTDRLPDVEILPYDAEDPHPMLQSRRIGVLHKITQKEHPILVCSIQSLLQHYQPQSFWASRLVKVSLGDKQRPKDVARSLEQIQYQVVEDCIELPGQFSVRGNILDVFPSGGTGAYRVRFGKNKVESLSSLSLTTQRSVESVESVLCLYPSEVPLDSASISKLRHAYRERFEPSIKQPVYEELRSGRLPAGAQQYLSLGGEVVTLLDLLGPKTAILFGWEARGELYHYWEGIQSRYSDVSVEPDRSVLTPEEAWLGPQGLEDKISHLTEISFVQEGGDVDVNTEPTGISRQRSTKDTLAVIGPWAKRAKRVVFSIGSDTRMEQAEVIARLLGLTAARVERWLDADDAATGCLMIPSPIHSGFFHRQTQTLVVSEPEIFGRVLDRTAPQQERNRIDLQSISDLSSLAPGDPVVHELHGIARFQGIEQASVGGTKREYLVLEFKDGGRQFVPMDELDLVNRYAGTDPEHVHLQEFGSPTWMPIVRDSEKEIVATAAGILDRARERRQTSGVSIKAPDAAYRRFAQEFPYPETADQATAVSDIISDLRADVPMDRVVCGDVGFGKTEVAMRAAFLAANSGCQVSVLAPTSLLAQQHFETFSERFASFDINIRSINACRGRREERELLDDVREGRVDILIGTNRLLSRDIEYPQLGLLIVDEEHRFGVEDKEAMEVFRRHVHTLALSATPIPRTLGMAMGGLRAFSIIATPPSTRMSVRTKVEQYSGALVREAIQRELLRHGQLFYLFNNTTKLKEKAEELAALVPEARVLYVHGRMSEVEVERVMRAFYGHEADVLVCTTIVEIGIDIPNANTMIIDHADRFGIAQLHQLRGRVGRSNRQAYAFLLTHGNVPKTALQRLHALAAATRLGEGFALAYQDMEMRGAGEILGDDQSGNIQRIGYALYSRLLRKAVTKLSEGVHPSRVFMEPSPPTIRLSDSAYIPESFVSVQASRLSLYKRLMDAPDSQRVDDLREEIHDRYGRIPEPCENLIAHAKVRALCKDKKIRSVTRAEDRLIVTLRPGRSVHSGALKDLAGKDSRIELGPKGDLSIVVSKAGGLHGAMLLLYRVLELCE